MIVGFWFLPGYDETTKNRRLKKIFALNWRCRRAARRDWAVKNKTVRFELAEEGWVGAVRSRENRREEESKVGERRGSGKGREEKRQQAGIE